MAYIDPITGQVIGENVTPNITQQTLNNTQGATQGAGPFTEYLRRLGLGGGGYWNPAQRYQASLYDPMRTLFQQEQTFAPLTGGIPGGGYWGDFMGQYLNQPRAVAQRAGGVLGSLFGATPGQRGELGLGFEPAYGEAGQDIDTGEGMSTLQALIAQALRPQWGAYGGARFAQQLPQMQQQWQLSPQQTFLDYIKNKYGLGGMFPQYGAVPNPQPTDLTQ